METYRCSEKAKSSFGKIAVRWSSLAMFAFTGYFFIETVWPSPHRSFADRIANAFGFALIYSTIQVWTQSPTPPSMIKIDGDVMLVTTEGRVHTFHRGELRTIIEKKNNLFSDGGLLVSSKTPFRAQLWGGSVWIPKEMQDYQTLKNLIEMWRNTQDS